MIQLTRLNAALADFESAEPFPHVVIDGFLDPPSCRTLQSHAPDPNWARWDRAEHAYQKAKLACSDLSLLHESFDELASELSSLSFLRPLSQALSGIRVYSDPYCFGAGLHATQSGGSLAPHRDAEFHNETGLKRALSLVLFLSDAAPEDGGALVLYKDREARKKIRPKVGRCVIFECSSRSIHGVEAWHGDSLRLSFASFYYAEDRARTGLIHAPDWLANTVDRKSVRPVTLGASRLFFLASAVIARLSMRLKSVAYRLASASGSGFNTVNRSNTKK